MSKSDWPLPFAEPEEVGMSSERLSRTKSRMQEFIDSGKDPNFNSMVGRCSKPETRIIKLLSLCEA